MKANKENEVKFMTTTETTVQKWGNSLAVRIPKEIAEYVAIQQGSEVEFKVINGAITLVPKKKTKQYSLEDLLAQCKPEQRHEEIDFGTTGKEMI